MCRLVTPRFRTWLLVAIIGSMAAGFQHSAEAAQPLPGGKARFTLVHGNLDSVGKTTARLMNLSFDATNGTVGATSWLWDSANKKGKSAYNSHTCTFDGNTVSQTLYTPTDWLVPSGQYYSWSGNYMYDTASRQLTINWTAGAPGNTETWLVANPTPALAEIGFLSSNYGITHGKGYGSNAPWSSFKTVSQVSRGPFSGRSSSVTTDPYGVIISVVDSAPASLDLTSFTFPSSPSPANSIHAWLPTSSCTGSCQTSRTGIVYHLSSNNTGRPMIWNHFCACLPSQTAFPKYDGGLHPWAFMQIIDDNDSHVGFVGVHVQHSTTHPNFYSLSILNVRK